MARGDDASLAAGRAAFQKELRAAKATWADHVEEEGRMDRLLNKPLEADLARKYPSLNGALGTSPTGSVGAATFAPEAAPGPVVFTKGEAPDGAA